MNPKTILKSIRLQNFRSYGDKPFNLSGGVNIIVGPNACGKTNLLEAVYVLARGRSFRAKDAELLQFACEWARIDAALEGGGERTLKLKANEGAIQKQFDLDGQQFSRLTHNRTLPVVLFEPNHLLLMSSSPDLRRSFLDDLIEQIEPGYATTCRHYKRVLAQRNRLLKINPPNIENQLFVWNIRISELGGKIARSRSGLVERFKTSINQIYNDIASHQTKVEVFYDSRFKPESYESALLHKLQTSKEQDVVRGFTAYGPHRDDLGILVNGHPAQEVASRGEVRTLVLALKILELQLLEQTRQTKPILLLDDVFSELDATRRQALTGFVEDCQTFITTTHADNIGKQLAYTAVICINRAANDVSR